MKQLIDSGFGALVVMAFTFAVVIVAATIVSVDVNASQLAQVSPINDPWVDRAVFDNCQQIEIYENQSTGIIEYRESDICQDIVIATRDATAIEQASYVAQRDARRQAEAQAQAKSDLKSDPESGQAYSVWVDTHVTQSQSCVTQMDQMSANPNTWDTLSADARNNAIRNIISCVRHAEYVNTKVVPNLFDLLVIEGIINVTDQ